MNIRQRIANIIDPPQKNSMGSELAADFMRYGVRTPAVPDWHEEFLDEREKYTGYMYGAVMRRANKVTWLATYNLRTGANSKTSKSAKAQEDELQHPYLQIIDESSTFTNNQFWYDTQTFIDLRGIGYLLVIRGKAGNTVGDPKEFKLINPYNITEVWDNENMQIVGYVETMEGHSREIPPHMMIRMKPLNPFSKIKPWSLADAAKSAQYGLKETMDQVTTGSRRNRKYPGVIMLGGNNVALDPEQVQNWKTRMAGKGRDGEPMFASAGTTNGSPGDIKWNDMQVDMRKSDLTHSVDIQINALTAVTGLSKTQFGIEQSGTTRDTAAIQQDLFVTDHGMPALQLILDALNQDYKNTYPDEYEKTGYYLYIESPLGEDRDAELTAVTNRINTYDLYESLTNKGYEPSIAAAYAMGDKDLSDIGEPTLKPKALPAAVPPGQPGQTPDGEPPVTPPVQDPVVLPPLKGTDSLDRSQTVQNRRMPLVKGQVRCKCCDGYGVHESGYRCERCLGTGSSEPSEKNNLPCAGARHGHEEHYHDDVVPVITNGLTTSNQTALQNQQAALKNSITNVDHLIVAASLNKVTSLATDFNTIDDLVSEAEQEGYASELESTLEAFYTVVVPLAGAADMSNRISQYGKIGTFSLDQEAQQYITVIANKAASSHVQTVLGDILNTVRTTTERLVQGELKTIVAKPGQTPEAVLAEARSLALSGVGRQQIVAAITQKYSDSISTTRVTAIARTECLPGETLVDAAVINAVHRRRYVGKMVKIKTRNGREFSATPNHPMLTSRGWLGAGDITEVDNLVCDARKQSLMFSGDPNIEGSPATLSEIFYSLKTVGVLERRRTAKPDFHGDGMDGEVEVLSPDRELRIGSFAPLYKPLIENILKPADMIKAPLCPDCGRLLSIQKQECLCISASVDSLISKDTIDKLGGDAKATSDTSTGFAAVVSPNYVANRDVTVKPSRSESSGVTEVGSLAEVSHLDSRFAQASADRSSVDVINGSNLGKSEAGAIELDDVISVELHDFDGYVYNLSTPYGYYTINGAYTGNTSRAFNRAQFEADKQFLQQNNLTSHAYKQWVTHSASPCPYCLQLASEPPIPFTQNFADVGDTLSATVTAADGTTKINQMPVTFEDISAGNAHVNCRCTYQLIIE